MRKLLYIAALSVLPAAGAQAHTELSSSTPADEAVVDTAPDQVTLHFSEPVRLTALSIEGPDAERRDLGPLPPAASLELSVAAPALPAGSYVVSWRALSADTHVMTGEFTFTVAAGAGHGQQSAP